MLKVEKAGERNTKKNNSGSSTIEAAIIFFTVFISVIALIYTCQLVYRQALLQTLASKTAERGAAIWNNKNRDMLVKRIYPVDNSVADLYKDIIGTQVDFLENTEKIDNFIALSKGDETSLQGKGIMAQAPEIIAEFMHDRLKITVSGKSKLPIGNLLLLLGLKDEIVLVATSEAQIHSTTDFIRNTDLVLETTGLDGLSGGQLVQYIPDVLKKIKESASTIFDLFK